MNNAMAKLAEALNIDHAKMPREQMAEAVCEKALKKIAQLEKLRSIKSATDKSALLSGRLLPCSTYTKVGADMTWPSLDQGDLEWQLRYGTEKDVTAARMRLASIVSGYRDMILMAEKPRNDICRAIRDAR